MELVEAQVLLELVALLCEVAVELRARLAQAAIELVPRLRELRVVEPHLLAELVLLDVLRVHAEGRVHRRHPIARVAVRRLLRDLRGQLGLRAALADVQVRQSPARDRAIREPSPRHLLARGNLFLLVLVVDLPRHARELRLHGLIVVRARVLQELLRHALQRLRPLLLQDGRRRTGLTRLLHLRERLPLRGARVALRLVLRLALLTLRTATLAIRIASTRRRVARHVVVRGLLRVAVAAARRDHVGPIR